MNDSWKEMPFGNLAAPVPNAIVGGPFGSNLVSNDYVESGVPVIRGQNMIGRWVGGEFVFVSEGKAGSLSSNLARPGDLIFTQRGTLGQVAIVPDGHYERYLVSQSQMKATIDAAQADAGFLYYFFSSKAQQDWIRSNAIQTGVPHTNLGILKKHPILLPPLREQKAITAILGTLDDKIEQNRQTVRALEGLARATFKAWFVDFEPVKAKAAGQVSFPGLPLAAFAAFPDRLVNSTIGPVPEGWGVGPLKEAIKLTMGQSPRSEFYNLVGEGLPFHQGVSDHGFRFPTRRVYCTVEGRMAEAGDVLLSVRAPVGRINVADVRMVLGRGLAAMRHKKGYQSFLLYLMQHHFAEEDAVGDGTIYKSVNKDFVEAMLLISPPVETLQAFEDIVAPMDAMISSLTKESSRLAALRDYLLPRLLSGRVRVQNPLKNAEELCSSY